MQIKTKLQYGSSSSLLYFFLPSCSFDDNCSAGRPYLCARRARSRRPHTHATCERRNDANASSEEVVVDVEVDRYIDEISASNLNCCCLYFFHRSSIIRHSRSYTTPTSKHVTITWYRLSRSKVYSSHTLTTFLTPLNQERRSSATYSCPHFLHR